MRTRSGLVRHLGALGVAPDDLVMVHSSMRAVGPVVGGPDVVIDALLEAVGPTGTVIMYVDWEDSAQEMTREDQTEPVPDRWLEEWPPFDPARARACRAYGVLPEFLRTWPGAERSGNPAASVTAVGAKASWLCADHPLDYGYGPGSPLSKLVEAGGKVLLLGCPLDTVTLLHFSEHVARLPGKRILRYRERILRDGVAEWVGIEEFDTGRPVVPSAPEDHFARLVEAFVRARDLRAGRVGGAPSWLFDAPALHEFAVAWLEERWGEDAPGGDG